MMTHLHVASLFHRILRKHGLHGATCSVGLVAKCRGILSDHTAIRSSLRHVLYCCYNKCKRRAECCTFATTMDKFVPHTIDAAESYESHLLGDVKAGFPSPAEEVREKLDLVKLLVRNRASTFFFRVNGVSMVDADMDEGDIIIVDRAVAPYNNCKAVCYIDGEYTVKRVEIGDNKVRLMPANENNKAYKPIEVTAENDFLIWGVVTYAIKKM